MSRHVNLTNPWIYVDDSDPAISYRDDAFWTTYNLPTDLSFLQPGSTNTPIYGTLRSTGTRVESYTFKYSFKGTSYQLQFKTSMGLNSSPCSIDGEVQLAYIQSNGLVICKNSTLSPTEHNLTVAMEPNSSFDGFSYMPIELPVNGADTLYYVQGSIEPGNSYEFDFYGTSAGIYATISFLDAKNQSATTLSYTVDQDAPVNFTIINPFPSQGSLTFYPQLLIQTLPLSRGQHTLVMSMWDVGNLNGIDYSMVIVQNSTQLHNLEAVPSTSISSSISSLPTVSSSPTSRIKNSHQIRPSIIVAITSCILALLLITGVWIWRRIIRQRAMLLKDPRLLPIGLTLPDQDQTPRFRIHQYLTREKTEKYRSAFGIQTPQDGGTPANVTEGDNGVVESERQVPPIVPPHYIIHQDGGAIAEEHEQEGQVEGQVVNLPPLYSSLAQAQSNLTHRSPD